LPAHDNASATERSDGATFFDLVADIADWPASRACSRTDANQARTVNVLSFMKTNRGKLSTGRIKKDAASRWRIPPVADGICRRSAAPAWRQSK